MSKADDLPDFAARLQRIMGQLNFSRVAMARELALDKTVVGRWLTGISAKAGRLPPGPQRFGGSVRAR